ncbi:hypothetical protein GUITHDRAFT_133731 [Guillardia theta CCMP2712]|uniref:Armadillo repeat-containing domain-containing protein n=1 Tax=Guillardia theta (strain CCMP2712) TaxID=905079 RepID=L1JWG6_GUITC|nr:hypothetical protein GUITHDRAFT_133731 [Guillardia theta CCMP2712]EKX52707.1 hypothetical protein GUITHDRAFT_133731 [Guillardia theta CCMP2712]|eukprot:XP_005839687.1 hypothetical protein GUITHDRAFT_133731 [Guillardia theta CCMP2712]
MAISDRSGATRPKLLFGFASNEETSAASSTISLSSVLSSSPLPASSIFSQNQKLQFAQTSGQSLACLIEKNASQPTHLCMISASLDILEEASTSSFEDQVSAASKLSNLALRPDLQQQMSTEPLLDRLVQCLISAQDECIQRFICMAICRLATNKDLIPKLVNNRCLVETLRNNAANFESGHWRQAARTLAIFIYRAGSQHRELLCQQASLECIKRLIQLEQTEIQVDALRALLPFTKIEDGVKMLSASDVWHTALRAASNGGVLMVQQLAANILQSALDSSCGDVCLCNESFKLLCDLSRKARRHSSGQKNVFAELICRLMVLNKSNMEVVSSYVESGACHEIVSVATLKEIRTGLSRQEEVNEAIEYSESDIEEIIRLSELVSI